MATLRTVPPLQVCTMGKALHPITNWSQYHKFRIIRGSLPVWVDVEAMHNGFHHAHHRQQGSCQLYTDKTIVMTYWLIWVITPSSSRDLLFGTAI